MKIEKIKWIDSKSPANAWTSVEDIENKSAYCFSVGVVIKEDKKYITVAPHWWKNLDNYDVCGCITIPKVAIVSRKKLK